MMAERRTQAERVATTRAALLDATIECLNDYGYGATTTRLVADRAGVSRGAQTHHFPSKHDLVVAALELLYERMAEDFRRRFQAFPADRQHLGGAVELLWEVVNTPEYAAVTEVTVAARTDDELRVVVHALSTSLEATVYELFTTLLAHLDLDPTLAPTIVGVGFAIVRGAALSANSGFGNPDELIALVSNVAQLLGNDSGDQPASPLLRAHAQLPQNKGKAP